MFHEGDTRQSSNDKPVALDWNLEMLVFEEGGKRRTQRKTIGARVRTNAGSGNRTRDTLVVGERSLHCFPSSYVNT